MAMGVLLVAGAKARYIAAYTFLPCGYRRRRPVGRLVNVYQIERLRVFLDEDNPTRREDGPTR